jgi:hypothetical protein
MSRDHNHDDSLGEPPPDHPDAADRPGAAPLFDGAFHYANFTWGRIRPVSIAIVNEAGRRVTIDVPYDWNPDPRTGEPTLDCNAECLGDVVALLFRTRHRMTKEEIVFALEDGKNSWGESAVKRALAELCKLKILNNNQRGEHKGYGSPKW